MHGLTKEHIKTLEAIDEDYLRRILKAHAKTPCEFLYLETGATPIKWIIAQRRINFLKFILSKENTELVKRVLEAKKQDPTPGDYIKLVEKDMLDLNITLKDIEESTKVELKKMVKESATTVSFEELKKQLFKHKKVKHIEYESLQMQPYLRSKNIHSEEVNSITALRSKCVRTIRSNFSKMFKNRLTCPLLCNKESPMIDTQDHVLICSKLKEPNPCNLVIGDVFGSVEEQEQVGQVFSKAMRQRKRLLDEFDNIPGALLDQSTVLDGAADV